MATDKLVDFDHVTDYISRVEVVRCKDCRFSEKNSGFLSCDFFNIWNVKQDGFCSYGEWRIKKWLTT